MAQLTQTNEQYYPSQQVYTVPAPGPQSVFVWTGGTDQSGAGYKSIGVDLIASVAGVSVTNFEVYLDNVKLVEGAGAGKYQLTSTNTVTLGTAAVAAQVVKIVLTTLLVIFK